MSKFLLSMRWRFYRAKTHFCPICGEEIMPTKGDMTFHCPACNAIISDLEQRKHEKRAQELCRSFETDPDAVAEVTNARLSKASFGATYRGCCELKSDYRTTAVIKTVDGLQIDYKEPKTCYVTFITPQFYPASIWTGKRMELFEGDRLAGYVKIIVINNQTLDRNKVFSNKTDILIDHEVLNHALMLSLEWGKNYSRPLNNRLMKTIPVLSGTDIDKVCEYVSTVRDDVLWHIYFENYDARNEKFSIDVEQATEEKYPWISHPNLVSLSSQGRYYSWHDDLYQYTNDKTPKNQ